MKENIFENKMDLKQLVLTIARFQELYNAYDKILENKDNESTITAREVLDISRYQSRIAEDFARFILTKNNVVELFNNQLLP